MSTDRLSDATALPAAVRQPRYRRTDHGIGIVHLGIGAFHRAHQAVYTEAALERSGGDWRTLGVSLRSPDVAQALNPQDGLYTLLVRDEGVTEARIIGNLAGVLFAPQESEALIGRLADPATRIVSLTITEKGYGLDRSTGGLDPTHPAIAHDLETASGAAQSAFGLLVAALRRRSLHGAAPLAVMSCDNFSANGEIARRLCLELAEQLAPDLLGWMGDHLSFPATMVDRITPASTERTFADARTVLGVEDRAAVEAEPFTQWVIADDFRGGRPDWEAGGALLVDDVTPYEDMKLRMLNGSHSMLAYAGFLAGHRYVRDVMRAAPLRALVQRHLKAASLTLGSGLAVDLASYAEDLLHRFSNPAIAHETYQIAMDGTQKLPQRIFAPALEALRRGQPLQPFAFATAAWVRYALGRAESGGAYDLRDPRSGEIERALAGVPGDADAICGALEKLPGLVPPSLAGAPEFSTHLRRSLGIMLVRSMRDAIETEVGAPDRLRAAGG